MPFQGILKNYPEPEPKSEPKDIISAPQHWQLGILLHSG